MPGKVFSRPPLSPTRGELPFIDLADDALVPAMPIAHI
jgi:hypothetical protein